MLMALYLTQLEVIFNILGALCDNSVMTVLPTLFYFKLAEKKQENPKKIMLVRGYFYFSLVLVAICLGSEILNLFE